MIAPADAAKKGSARKSRSRFFLNSESNYRSADNFVLFIGKKGSAKFKRAGIADPADHFNGKKVRATGTVQLYRDRPEIVIEDPKQIEIAEK